MENFSKLVFISTILYNSGSQSNHQWPNWLNPFIYNLQNDNYYIGSVMYRYSWKGKYYFQLEVPSETAIFCQIIDSRGRFLKWPNNKFQEFFDERTDETKVWVYKVQHQY